MRVATVWTAEKIKQLRAAYDESQNDFCRRLRLSVDRYRQLEQGRHGSPSGPVQELLDRLQEEIPSNEEPQEASTP